MFKITPRVIFINSFIFLLICSVIVIAPSDKTIVSTVINNSEKPIINAKYYIEDYSSIITLRNNIDQQLQDIEGLECSSTMSYFFHQDELSFNGAEVNIYYLNENLWEQIPNNDEKETLILDKSNSLFSIQEIPLVSEDRVINKNETVKLYYSPIPEDYSSHSYQGDIVEIFHPISLLSDRVLKPFNLWGDVIKPPSWHFVGQFMHNRDEFQNIKSSHAFQTELEKLDERIHTIFKNEGFQRYFGEFPILRDIYQEKRDWNSFVEGITFLLFLFIIFIEIFMLDQLRRVLEHYKQEFLIYYYRGLSYSKLNKKLWLKMSFYPLLINILLIVILSDRLYSIDFDMIGPLLTVWVIMHFFSTSYLSVSKSYNIIDLVKEAKQKGLTAGKDPTGLADIKAYAYDGNSTYLALEVNFDNGIVPPPPEEIHVIVDPINLNSKVNETVRFDFTVESSFGHDMPNVTLYLKATLNGNEMILYENSFFLGSYSNYTSFINVIFTEVGVYDLEAVLFDDINYAWSSFFSWEVFPVDTPSDTISDTSVTPSTNDTTSANDATPELPMVDLPGFTIVYSILSIGAVLLVVQKKRY